MARTKEDTCGSVIPRSLAEPLDIVNVILVAFELETGFLMQHVGSETDAGRVLNSL